MAKQYIAKFDTLKFYIYFFFKLSAVFSLVRTYTHSETQKQEITIVHICYVSQQIVYHYTTIRSTFLFSVFFRLCHFVKKICS